MTWSARPGRPWVCLVLFLLAACGETKPLGDEAPPLQGAWLAYRNEAGFDPTRAAMTLDGLVATGYGWVALGPEPRMADVTRPQIEADPHDDDTRGTIRSARAAGLEVMLCPRIESPTFFRAENPLWRGDIAMGSARDWELFHDRLEAMLVHYATMATEEDVGLFSLGLEYRHSTRDFPERWRQIIAAVRRVYAGPVTYSANWYEEYREIDFWDSLDYIGIGAYFPIASQAGAPAVDMQTAWTARLLELAELARRFERPMIFTEIGYPGLAAAGRRPWDWADVAGKTIDHAHQADCFRAFFAAMKEARFPTGFFIWRYEVDLGPVRDWEYCPANRPAEAVIRRALAR